MTTVPSEEAIDAMALALQANGATVVAYRDGNEKLAPAAIRAVLATALVAGAAHLTAAIECEITDEAVRAALNAPVGASRPLDGYADWAINEMRASLKAALAHLTVPREHGSYDSDEAFRRGVTIGRSEAEGPSPEDVRVDAAYQRGVEAGKTQAPPEKARTEAYAEGYRHGVNVGRAEGTEVFTLVDSSGPTDYEVWRDAMVIAGQRTPREQDGSAGDVEDVVYEARKYARQLRTCGVVQPEVEICCNACGDVEHATADCPHQAEAEIRVTETELAADDPLLDHI